MDQPVELTGHVSSDIFKAALLSYRYQAPSLSLLEGLYLENFWDFLAARVYPPWLAPNIITLLGGACTVVGFTLTVWYSPALCGEAPRWVYFSAAALLLSYQSLDGSDGKQARRTGSGSALGELMDHGLDACMIPLISSVAIDGMGLGWSSVELWCTMFGAQVPHAL